MDLSDVIAGHGGITRLLVAYPACYEFELGDGRVLELWPGGYDHGDEWKFEGEVLTVEVKDPTRA